MTHSLHDGTTALMLPEDLYWEDEWAWTPVAQTLTRSVTGAAILQIGTRTGGRPITLASRDRVSGWMRLGEVIQLQSWAARPGAVFTLRWRGQVWSVRFRPGTGDTEAAVIGEPVVYYSDPLPDDWVIPTLRLITVD